MLFKRLPTPPPSHQVSATPSSDKTHDPHPKTSTPTVTQYHQEDADLLGDFLLSPTLLDGGRPTRQDITARRSSAVALLQQLSPKEQPLLLLEVLRRSQAPSVPPLAQSFIRQTVCARVVGAKRVCDDGVSDDEEDHPVLKGSVAMMRETIVDQHQLMANHDTEAFELAALVKHHRDCLAAFGPLDEKSQLAVKWVVSKLRGLEHNPWRNEKLYVFLVILSRTDHAFSVQEVQQDLDVLKSKSSYLLASEPGMTVDAVSEAEGFFFLADKWLQVPGLSFHNITDIKKSVRSLERWSGLPAHMGPERLDAVRYATQRLRQEMKKPTPTPLLRRDLVPLYDPMLADKLSQLDTSSHQVQEAAQEWLQNAVQLIGGRPLEAWLTPVHSGQNPSKAPEPLFQKKSSSFTPPWGSQNKEGPTIKVSNEYKLGTEPHLNLELLLSSQTAFQFWKFAHFLAISTIFSESTENLSKAHAWLSKQEESFWHGTRRELSDQLMAHQTAFLRRMEEMHAQPDPHLNLDALLTQDSKMRVWLLLTTMATARLFGSPSLALRVASQLIPSPVVSAHAKEAKAVLAVPPRQNPHQEAHFRFDVASKHIRGQDRAKQTLKAYANSLLGGRPQPSLALFGPPGIGKTALIKAFVSAYLPDHSLRFLSMRGNADARSLLGTSQSLVGAEPGAIAQSLMRRQANKVVIIFDDIDHASAGMLPGASCKSFETFGQLIDHEPFVDHYFKLPLDTSHCLFLATGNDIRKIGDHIARRLFVTHLTEPSFEDIVHVVSSTFDSELQKAELPYRPTPRLIAYLADSPRGSAQTAMRPLPPLIEHVRRLVAAIDLAPPDTLTLDVGWAQKMEASGLAA